MLLVRDLAVVALLAVACSANDLSHRFFFPSSRLFLDVLDAQLNRGLSGDNAGGSSPEGGHRTPEASAVGQQGGPSAAPSEASGPPSAVREPSKCMFAIVSCCRAGSMRVDTDCFARSQCHGPFWGESPCRRESAVAAYNIVLRYYAAKEAERNKQAEAASAGAPPNQMEEESSPFDPIGPLPSREEERRY